MVVVVVVCVCVWGGGGGEESGHNGDYTKLVSSFDFSFVVFVDSRPC